MQNLQQQLRDFLADELYWCLSRAKWDIEKVSVEDLDDNVITRCTALLGHMNGENLSEILSRADEAEICWLISKDEEDKNQGITAIIEKKLSAYYKEELSKICEELKTELLAEYQASLENNCE